MQLNGAQARIYQDEVVVKFMVNCVMLKQSGTSTNSSSD